MKKLFATLGFICLMVSGSSASAQRGVPRFEDYRATVYRGKSAPVNLRSAKGASAFRTRLREGAKEGVNFAGRFTLVSWGCGTGCLQAVIIDARTGRVFFPDALGGFGVWLWPDTGDEAMQFKPESRLLIMSGTPGEANNGNSKSGIYYYEWTGTRLRLLKLIEKSREEGR